MMTKIRFRFYSAIGYTAVGVSKFQAFSELSVVENTRETEVLICDSLIPF